MRISGKEQYHDSAQQDQQERRVTKNKIITDGRKKSHHTPDVG